MSKFVVCCVFDSKVMAYDKPFVQRSKGEALRGFSEAANDPATSLNKYPADFTLFYIADYDDVTGVMTPLPSKVSFGSANEFLKSPDGLADRR